MKKLLFALLATSITAFAAGPGYVLSTVHTNMIPLVQATSAAAARTAIGAAAVDGTDSLVWAASILGGRTWDSYVTASPGDDLVAKMAAITTATSANRVCLYVKNGTYTVTSTLTSKNWVDIVGESEADVIITTSGDYDTGKIESQSLWANMTLESTGAYYRYPLHIDWGPPSALINPSSTMVLVNVTCTSTGDKKAGCGIGLYALQRLILVNCTFTSSYRSGLYAHNQNAQASPAELYIINCTATSTAAALDGFEWVNLGSGKEDQIRIIGGTFVGGAGGYAIREWNNISPAGASEARISISPSTTAATTLFSSVDTRVSMPDILPTIVTSDRFRTWAGTTRFGPNTIEFKYDGTASLYGGNVTFTNQSGTTSRSRITFGSVNNNTIVGVNGNTDLNFVGSDAYASVFGTGNNYPVEIWQGNARRLKVEAAGARFTVPIGVPAYAKGSRPSTGIAAGDMIFQTTDTPGPRWYDGANWITAAGVADP